MCLISVVNGTLLKAFSTRAHAVKCTVQELHIKTVHVRVNLFLLIIKTQFKKHITKEN